MSDEIKDAILALQNGNSDEFRDSINSVLMSKAHDAIELERVSAGQKYFGDSDEVSSDDDLGTEE